MRVDAFARSMMSNDMTTFWKDAQKDINSKVPIATKVQTYHVDIMNIQQQFILWHADYLLLNVLIVTGKLMLFALTIWYHNNNYIQSIADIHVTLNQYATLNF